MAATRSKALHVVKTMSRCISPNVGQQVAFRVEGVAQDLTLLGRTQREHNKHVQWHAQHTVYTSSQAIIDQFSFQRGHDWVVGATT